MDRRQFLKNFTLLSAAGSVPAFLKRSLLQARAAGLGGGSEDPILVICECNGGLDGLSAVIPYRNDFYYAQRPTLGIGADHVLKLDDEFGFHPFMSGLKSLWDDGLVSVVHGIGYPNPTRSHFQSLDVWWTASRNDLSADGWLARYVANLDDPAILQAVNIGSGAPRALIASSGSAPGIRSVDTYEFTTDPQARIDQTARNAAFQQVMSLPIDNSPEQEFAARTALEATVSSLDLIDGQDNYVQTVEYPDTPFAGNLQTVARIIAADLGVRVFYATLGGFDTHANQIRSDNNREGLHSRLLRTFSDAVQAFWQDLRNMGRSRDVLIMTFSEFGRRLSENGSLGTDHGTANPMFFIGERVRPGFLGEMPSLAPDMLDDVGDMIYKIDFRRAYASALQGWLGADAGPILGEEFAGLDLFSI